MRVRRRILRNRRRGDGRRDEYTGEANIEAQRGEHTGRREANPIDEPGSCQERTGSILIGPSGAGAYAGGTIPGGSYVATVDEDDHFPNRDDSPVFGALVLRAKARSAYRAFYVT